MNRHQQQNRLPHLGLLWCLMAIAAMADSQLSLSLVNPGPFELNAPIEFRWKTNFDVLYDDARFIIYILPTEYLQNCTLPITWPPTCLTDAYACEYDFYVSAHETNGTVKMDYECTNDVTSYSAILLAFNDSEPCISSPISFQVDYPFSLEVVSTFPPHRNGGIMIKYNVPVRHYTSDKILLIDTSCEATPDECVMDWSYLEAGTTGTVHLPLSYDWDRANFSFKLLVGQRELYTHPVFQLANITGSCESDCETGQGQLCVTNDDCNDCRCTIHDPPVLKPDEFIEVIGLLGTPPFSKVLTVNASTDLSNVFLIPLGVWPNGVTLTRDPTKLNEWELNWVFNDYAPGFYSLTIVAFDEVGFISNHVSVSLEVRESICTIWGDPHVVTFDRAYYDFQGLGDFVALKARDTKDLSPAMRDFELVARFFACSPEVTCTNGIGFNTPVGSFSFYFLIEDESLSCTKYHAALGGVPIELSATKMNITKNSHVFGTLMFNDGMLTVNLLDSVGIRIQFDCSYNLVIAAKMGWVNHTVGLCGDFNHRETDDFLLFNGTVLFDGNVNEQPTLEQIYRQFGLKTRVEKTISPFDYALFNTSYEEVNNETWQPAFAPVWESEEARLLGETMCNFIPNATPQDVQACLFEVSIMGPDAAFTAMNIITDRCNHLTDGSSCTPPNGCPNWCNLGGSCVEVSPGFHQCNCETGFEGADCLRPGQQHSSEKSIKKSSHSLDKSIKQSSTIKGKSSSQPEVHSDSKDVSDFSHPKVSSVPTKKSSNLPVSPSGACAIAPMLASIISIAIVPFF